VDGPGVTAAEARAELLSTRELSRRSGTSVPVISRLTKRRVIVPAVVVKRAGRKPERQWSVETIEKVKAEKIRVARIGAWSGRSRCIPKHGYCPTLDRLTRRAETGLVSSGSGVQMMRWRG